METARCLCAALHACVCVCVGVDSGAINNCSLLSTRGVLAVRVCVGKRFANVHARHVHALHSHSRLTTANIRGPEQHTWGGGLYCMFKVIVVCVEALCVKCCAQSAAVCVCVYVNPVRVCAGECASE